MLLIQIYSRSEKIIGLFQQQRAELCMAAESGHSGINRDRMMEFFIENLVMYPAVTEIPAKATR